MAVSSDEQVGMKMPRDEKAQVKGNNFLMTNQIKQLVRNHQ